MKNIGGPPPAAGDTLCTGYRCHGRLKIGTVLTVCAPRGPIHRWAAIVQAGDSLHIVTDLDLHVGMWRSADRANEHPDESDAAQKRQQAAWRAAEKAAATGDSK